MDYELLFLKKRKTSYWTIRNQHVTIFKKFWVVVIIKRTSSYRCTLSITSMTSYIFKRRLKISHSSLVSMLLSVLKHWIIIFQICLDFKKIFSLVIIVSFKLKNSYYYNEHLFNLSVFVHAVLLYTTRCISYFPVR